MPQVLASTVFRLEEWHQLGGAGIVELRGGELETALFVQGEPLAFDAADCSGSVGRFVALLPNVHAAEIASQISQFAEQGFFGGDPLSLQIAPLLWLLPSGHYRLTLKQLPDAYQCIDWEQHTPEARGTVAGYFPYDNAYNFTPTLCATQPMLDSALDDATINGYLSRIERGERPALITIGARNHIARFILDGHHKLFAYWCCGVTPHALHVEFQLLSPISREVAQRTLQELSWLTASYLRTKK